MCVCVRVCVCVKKETRLETGRLEVCLLFLVERLHTKTHTDIHTVTHTCTVIRLTGFQVFQHSKKGLSIFCTAKQHLRLDRQATSTPLVDVNKRLVPRAELKVSCTPVILLPDVSQNTFGTTGKWTDMEMRWKG